MKKYRVTVDEKRHYEIACEENARLRATIERVRRLHDALDAETDLTSPDDEITRSAAARKIAAALDGWTDPAKLRRMAAEEQSAPCGRPASLPGPCSAADWCCKGPGTAEQPATETGLDRCSGCRYVPCGHCADEEQTATEAIFQAGLLAGRGVRDEYLADLAFVKIEEPAGWIKVEVW